MKPHVFLQSIYAVAQSQIQHDFDIYCSPGKKTSQMHPWHSFNNFKFICTKLWLIISKPVRSNILFYLISKLPFLHPRTSLSTSKLVLSGTQVIAKSHTSKRVNFTPRALMRRFPFPISQTIFPDSNLQYDYL